MELSSSRKHGGCNIGRPAGNPVVSRLPRPIQGRKGYQHKGYGDGGFHGSLVKIAPLYS